MKHSNIFKYVAGVAVLGFMTATIFWTKNRCLPFHRKNI